MPASPQPLERKHRSQEIQAKFHRDYDGLLEACFVLGGGTWSHFERLARQSSNLATFPNEAAQLLSCLGYIDLGLNGLGTRIQQWKVSPTILYSTSNGCAFVAGYRPHSLLRALQQEARNRGGEFIKEPNEHGPARYGIAGIGREFLPDLAESLCRITGIQIRAVERPDRSIAAALPPLSATLTEDRIITSPEVAAQFDVSRAVWTPISFANLDGLYRTDSMPRSYVLRRGHTHYELSYRVGKHLAGASNERSLVAYDNASLQLVCPLGAQLPGLYERAVVLSSGLPPTIDLRRRNVVYQQVPNEIASAVWAALYS